MPSAWPVRSEDAIVGAAMGMGAKSHSLASVAVEKSFSLPSHKSQPPQAVTYSDRKDPIHSTAICMSRSAPESQNPASRHIVLPVSRGDWVRHCMPRTSSHQSQHSSRVDALVIEWNPDAICFPNGKMDIGATIQDLVAESQRSKKSRVQNVTQLVNTICDHANRSGLRNDALRSIIELVREPSTLNQTSITTLIKSLYPAQRVPSSHASLVVAALGSAANKPSPATQSLLLGWLVLIRTALEEWSILERLYSILFNLLDMLTIRTNLCRLLCLITRRKHVKPWRIHRLHELSQHASNDQALNALLKVYQNFYPDVIVPQGKSLELFKGLDTEWIERLNTIQEQNNLNGSLAAAYENVNGGSKRRKTEVIPKLQTRQVHDHTVVLEELRTVEDFGNQYERIEYPSQIIAALDNQHLQRLILLRDDTLLDKRLNNWLAVFFDAYMQRQVDEDQADRVLTGVLDQLSIFVRHTKIVPTAFTKFLSLYAEKWDGVRDQSSILSIVGYLELDSYQDYRSRLLEGLEQAVLDGTESSTIRILMLYTALIRHWTTHLLLKPSRPVDSTVGYAETLAPLISHCSALVLQLLTSKPSSTAQATIQAYLHSVANVSSLALEQPGLMITVPPSLQTYLTMFTTPTIYTISSLTSMLCLYKDVLDQYLPSQQDSGKLQQLPRSAVSNFNGYIMDFCNLYWRSRAFNTSDRNAKGCLVNQDIVKALQKYVESIPVQPRYSLPALFSPSFHPALSAIAIQSFRDMEDKVLADNSDQEDVLARRHGGPVTQRSLNQLQSEGGLEVSWNDYRREVLDLLAATGAEGLSVLVQQNIKTS